MYTRQAIGSIIQGRYHILSVLGHGGSGITYEAEDNQTNLRVALKELSLRNLSNWKKLELFEREAQILKNLDHPAIPSYRDYFQVDTASDRCFYIVQELADGNSLTELVAAGERFAETEVRRIALEVLQILQYLHGLNPPVIHRDIKPQNIIRQADGQIFLVDFGAVQTMYRETAAFGSTVVGTYGYMPPEQFRGQAYPTTDLYGLGATLLHLLTHRNPADLPQSRLKYTFRPYANISEAFAKWLDGLLEPLAEDRFDASSTAIAALTNPPPDRVQSSAIVSPQPSQSSLQKPTNSAIELTRSQQKLLIKIPLYEETGCLQSFSFIFLLISDAFFFLVTLILLITIGLGGALLSLLLLIPSILVTISVMSVPAKKVSVSLEMTEDTFTLLGYRNWRKVNAKVEDIESVELCATAPDAYTPTQVITLRMKARTIQFGADLTDAEKEWVVSEIRTYLQERNQLKD